MSEKEKIYTTINEVMKKVNAISKGRENQGQGFMYRGIDDVMNELHPILAECGLFVTPQVMEAEYSERKTARNTTLFYSRLKIKFTFTAIDGSSIESIVIGEGMDSGDKASNKALSAGLKYALIQTLCIPTEEDKDPDSTSKEVAPKSQSQPRPKQSLAPKTQAPNNELENIMKALEAKKHLFNEEMKVRIAEYKHAGNLAGLKRALQWVDGLQAKGAK